MTLPVPASPAVPAFARSVAIGLCDTPRWLPSRFLYDDIGSGLFERICELPEYYLTRTEATILERSADEIARITGPVALIELGSGSSVKTDRILSAYTGTGRAVQYVPVDVSAAILEVARRRIERRFPLVKVRRVHGEYERAMPLLREHHPAMLLFLGSTIGNLNHAESLTFWGQVGRSLPRGGWVLLGVDLVKDPAVIDAAYNDAAGVSAAFTRNIFERMNRELGSGLDVSRIAHEARWNEDWQRVEIGGRFEIAQDVYVAPLKRSFRVEAGELVMTEISRKFVAASLSRYLECFGLETVRMMTDDNNWFAVLLLRKGTFDG